MTNLRREAVTAATQVTQARADDGGRPTVDAKGPQPMPEPAGAANGGDSKVPARGLKIRRIN